MITFLMRPAMWPVLTEEVIWSSPLTRDPWLCEAVVPRWFADEGQFVPSSDDGQLVPKQQCTEQLSHLRIRNLLLTLSRQRGGTPYRVHEGPNTMVGDCQGK